MHEFYGALCILLGLAMAGAGYWMLHPYERSKDATGFAGSIFSRHLVIATIGNLLVILGLIVAVIFGFLFFRT